MANWCGTTIAFYSQDKIQLEALHTAISNRTHENIWLGNICTYHGLSAENYSCRSLINCIGEISQDEYSYWYFLVDQEDAWDPHISVWESVLDMYYRKVEFEYRSEEDGCGIFVNSDIEGYYFPERFIIDACVKDTEDRIYTSTFDETLSLCKQILRDRSISSIEQARYIGEHFVKKEGYDGWFNIYEFEMV